MPISRAPGDNCKHQPAIQADRRQRERNAGKDRDRARRETRIAGGVRKDRRKIVETVERRGRIDCADRRAQRRCEVGRPLIRTNHQVDVAARRQPAVIAEGDVELRLRRIGQAVLQHAADDADDLRGPSLRDDAFEATADHRPAVIEGRPHEVFVDDERRHAGGGIALGEQPALAQTQLQRREVAGRHDVTEAPRDDRLGPIAGKTEPGDHRRVAERRHVRRARQLNPGHRPNVVDNRGHELLPALRRDWDSCGVTRAAMTCVAS